MVKLLLSSSFQFNHPRVEKNVNLLFCLDWKFVQFKLEIHAYCYFCYDKYRYVFCFLLEFYHCRNFDKSLKEFFFLYVSQVCWHWALVFWFVVLPLGELKLFPTSFDRLVVFFFFGNLGLQFLFICTHLITKKKIDSFISNKMKGHTWGTYNLSHQSYNITISLKI